MALGSESGQKEIATFEESGLNSFCEVRTSAKQIGTEDVQINTLDEFCAERGISSI